MERARIYGIAALIAAVLLAGLVVTLAGCGKDDKGDGDDDQKVVTEEMKEAFDLETGQHFDFSLESNPTTGYSWQTAQLPDDRVVQVVSSQFLAPSGDLVGAPGEEVWQFRAVGTGSTSMVLEYARPWEAETPPARRYTITFNVAQADNEINQSFKIMVGQTFDLTLDTDPSAGYSWSMAEEPDAGVLKLVSSDIMPSSSSVAGAPQQQVWRFEGVAAGKTSFVLEYRGPGADAPVERKDTVTVTVSAAPPPVPVPPRTYSDPSAPITAERGEVFILQVNSSAGTPYQWRLAEEINTSMLKFMGSATGADHGIGGEVTTEFTFEGLGPGQQAIKLGLYEAGSDQPSQVVQFNVTVR